MKKLKNALGAVAVIASGIEGAQASADQSYPPLAVKRGVYYPLTSETAKALKINLGRLIEEAQLTNTQQLAFQIQEDGELDLSIYEAGVFTQIRSDLIKGPAN